jgi:hypothetical protein
MNGRCLYKFRAEKERFKPGVLTSIVHFPFFRRPTCIFTIPERYREKVRMHIDKILCPLQSQPVMLRRVN